MVLFLVEGTMVHMSLGKSIEVYYNYNNNSTLCCFLQCYSSTRSTITTVSKVNRSHNAVSITNLAEHNLSVQSDILLVIFKLNELQYLCRAFLVQTSLWRLFYRQKKISKRKGLYLSLFGMIQLYETCHCHIEHKDDQSDTKSKTCKCQGVIHINVPIRS